MYLELNRANGVLHEKFSDGVRNEHVASWRIKRLADALNETHPATMWVQAVPSKKDGAEYFGCRNSGGESRHQEKINTRVLRKG